MRTHRNLHAPQTVVDCYSLFDKFFPICGLLDYTEGIYHNDPHTPYEVAQRNQITYLLRADHPDNPRPLQIELHPA